ncbi:hypothetical protein HanHA300_Chr03g0093141 [Helianthus annuus]|nr:hypothetical protein HanHA300_Chr03g0093141 [Helianthus annuus]
MLQPLLLLDLFPFETLVFGVGSFVLQLRYQNRNPFLPYKLWFRSDRSGD